MRGCVYMITIRRTDALSLPLFCVVRSRCYPGNLQLVTYNLTCIPDMYIYSISSIFPFPILPSYIIIINTDRKEKICSPPVSKPKSFAAVAPSVAGTNYIQPRYEYITMYQRISQ